MVSFILFNLYIFLKKKRTVGEDFENDTKVKRASKTNLLNRFGVCLWTKKEKAFLKTIKITLDDPVCIFNWRDDNINQLIAIINNPLYVEALPPFPIIMPMTTR